MEWNVSLYITNNLQRIRAGTPIVQMVLATVKLGSVIALTGGKGPTAIIRRGVSVSPAQSQRNNCFTLCLCRVLPIVNLVVEGVEPNTVYAYMSVCDCAFPRKCLDIRPAEIASGTVQEVKIHISLTCHCNWHLFTFGREAEVLKGKFPLDCIKTVM